MRERRTTYGGPSAGVARRARRMCAWGGGAASGGRLCLPVGRFFMLRESSDCDGCAYRRVRAIVDELEIVESVLEDRRGPAPDHEPRQRQRHARELLLSLPDVVRI